MANIIFQDIREKNENVRISNEMVRQNNELLRSEKDILRDRKFDVFENNEAMRKISEIKRKELEETFKNNEEVRQKNFNAIITASKDVDLSNTVAAEIIGARGEAENLNGRFEIISNKIRQMNNQVEEILYEPIKIKSFVSDKTTLERGQIINRIVLSWELTSDPLTQKINGQIIDSILREYVIEKTFSENEEFTLEVLDKKGNKDIKKISLKFLNKIYYGTSNRISNDTTLVNSLQNKILSEEKIKNITLTSNEYEYMVYCIPSELGECHFYIYGIEDGFEKVATIQYTNEFGSDCEYNIYKTENVGLGKLDIEIK